RALRQRDEGFRQYGQALEMVAKIAIISIAHILDPLVTLAIGLEQPGGNCRKFAQVAQVVVFRLSKICRLYMRYHHATLLLLRRLSLAARRAASRACVTAPGICMLSPVSDATVCAMSSNSRLAGDDPA